MKTVLVTGAAGKKHVVKNRDNTCLGIEREEGDN
jgi:hypothetical protein